MRTSIANNLIPQHVAQMPAMPQVDDLTTVIPSLIGEHLTGESIPTPERVQFEDHYKSSSQHLDNARHAIDIEDWDAAKLSYSNLLGALTAVVPDAGGRPAQFYTYLRGGVGTEGEDLYLEAAIGAAIFADVGKERTILDHLGFARHAIRCRRDHSSDPKHAGLNGDLARLKMARAVTVTRYADDIHTVEDECDALLMQGIQKIADGTNGTYVNPYEEGSLAGITAGASINCQHEYYENAEKKIDAALKLIDVDKVNELKDIAYVGHLMRLQVLGRQADCAYWRGDPDKLRRELHVKLDAAARSCAKGYDALGVKGKETAASYIAETVQLFLRMGAMKEGLDLARFIDDEHPALVRTEAWNDLLTSEDFASFVERGTRIKADDVVHKEQTWSTRVKLRAKAAVANAQSNGPLETLLVAAPAAAVGYAASRGIMAGEPNAALDITMMAGSATTARMAASIANGWFSDRAVSSAKLPFPTDTWKDIQKIALQTIGTGAAMTFPAMLTRWSSESLAAWWNPVSTGAKFYTVDAYNWLSALLSEGSGNLAGRMLSNFTNLKTAEDWFFALVRPYEAATGMYYGACFASSKLRERLTKYSPYFTLGAVFLSAELCMQIAGASNYGERMFRSIIGAVEMFAMLMAVGVGSIAKDGTIAGAMDSFWKKVKDSRFQFSLIGMSLMVGVSSAIGGKIKASAQDYDNLFLTCVQGGAISFALLLLPLLVSGVIKQNLTPRVRFKEWSEDSKGDAVANKSLEFALTGLDIFRQPYAINKIVRPLTPWFDWLPAGIRAGGLGAVSDWDSNMGMIAMALPNLIAFNNWAGMTFNDVGGTLWERGALKGILDDMSRAQARDVSAHLFDHLRKASQRQPITHLFYPHHPADRFWPLASIQRIFRQPKYPMLPSPHYFASFVQMVRGGTEEKMSAESLKGMLSHIECLAAHPRNYSVMRPVVQALYAARARGDETRHNDPEDGEGASANGLILDAFFRERPWLIDLLNIDRTALTPHEQFRYRRKWRSWIISRFRMDKKEYKKRVREHRANRQRLLDEKKGHKEAKAWAKERMGTDEERGVLRAQYTAELEDANDLELRRIELMAIYKERPQTLEEQLAAFSYAGTDEKEKKKMEKQKAKFLNKRAKRIQRLAARVAKAEGLKGEERAARKQALLEEYAGKDDAYLWNEEMSRLKPRLYRPWRTHERWRKKAIERLAKYRMRLKENGYVAEREMQLAREAGQRHAARRAESPIEGLLR